MSFDPPPLPASFTQPQFQVWWQQVLSSLKTELGALATAQAALAAAVAAQSTANTAVTDAATAQGTANIAKRNDKISASWTSPGSVLGATDAGSNATITVSAHSRKYGDNSSLSVAGGTLTGKSYATDYYIYYDDTTTSDTTPTYTATTNPNTAAYNAAAGRHFVGKIKTPAAAGAPTSGGTTPPGTVWDGTGEIP